MTKFITTMFILSTCTSLASGQNLVPNNSFEEYIQCPNSNSMIWSVQPWVSVYGSVDYYNVCGINGFGIPVSWGGGGDARTGNAYIGIGVWSAVFDNAREFAGVQLTETLIAGKKYDVKFYISMTDSNWYAVKNFGAFFSQAQPPHNKDTILSYEPQITYNEDTFLINKLSWIKIEGSFIAEGGEHFITIGNFDDDNKIDTFFVTGGGALNPSYPDGWKNSGYFIDDVSVILDTTWVGVGEISELVYKTYPNPFTSQTILQTDKVLTNATLTLYNSLGQQVRQVNSISGLTLTLNRDNLISGLYYFQLTQDNQTIATDKLVITD